MPQGTYMLLLDCTEWCRKHGITIDELQKRGASIGVIWQDGRPFHSPCGIRMNLALPFSLVEEVCICVEVKKILQRERTDKSKGVLLGKIIRPMTGWKI